MLEVTRFNNYRSRRASHSYCWFPSGSYENKDSDITKYPCLYHSNNIEISIFIADPISTVRGLNSSNKADNTNWNTIMRNGNILPVKGQNNTPTCICGGWGFGEINDDFMPDENYNWNIHGGRRQQPLSQPASQRVPSQLLVDRRIPCRRPLPLQEYAKMMDLLSQM